MAKVKNDDLRIRWRTHGDWREGRAPGLRQSLSVHLLFAEKVREAGVFYGGKLVEKLPCTDYDLTAAKVRAQELVATFVAIDAEHDKARAAHEAKEQAQRAAETQRAADRARALELAAEVRRYADDVRDLSTRDVAHLGVQLAEVVTRLLGGAQ